MKFEYLIFNVIILLFPVFGLTLYKRARWPALKEALLAIIAMGTPYIIWDYVVTDNWWRFNESYITELRFGVLPLEEIFFFLTVPWSCLVIWVNLKEKISGEWRNNIEQIIVVIASGAGLMSFFQQWWYSLSVSVLVGLVAAVSLNSTRWLRTKTATVFLVVVTILTLIFNGYLTARPIVLYNVTTLSNIRIYTVPLEDIFYGLVLVSGVVMIYERLVLLNTKSTGLQKLSTQT